MIADTSSHPDDCEDRIVVRVSSQQQTVLVKLDLKLRREQAEIRAMNDEIQRRIR